MPYTEATLMEIQRLGVVAPITVPHIATEDTTVMGYDVPKVTLRTAVGSLFNGCSSNKISKIR